MRQSRSSTIKHEIEEMEIQKLNSNNSKLKEEAHLSGAYIRSLVKQLTSSSSSNPTETMTEITTKPLQQQQALPHKKQVRRRLHTSRPYQERLLNMAEARREIVTALKFHRASMKQATENQNQNQNPPTLFDHHHQQQEEEDSVKIKCRRNHRIYPASSSSSSSSNMASFSPYQAQYIWQNQNQNQNHNQNTTITNLPLAMDHQTLANFPLPNQALGLNLNFQDFNNIEFSSATISPAAEATNVISAAAEASPSSMHAAMDEEAIAEIKSMGEQHQIEWSDTMNLVTSAYWSNLLSPEEDHHHRRDQFPFDDQFPSWLTAGDLTHHLDDSYSSDDYFNNSPSLSSMDIGEIDGMDGDWLA